jgi:hypothetical protein
MIALIAVIIAVQQWRTARAKLKLDLFDKRFVVYDGARAFIGAVTTSGKVKDEELVTFLISTREARWLLSKDVQRYLKEQIYDPALGLQNLNDNFPSITMEKARAKNLSLQTKIKQTIRGQYEELEKVFAPFLQLRH